MIILSVVLYGCNVSAPKGRQQTVCWCLNTRMPKGIFEPERDDVRESSRKLFHRSVMAILGTAENKTIKKK